MNLRVEHLFRLQCGLATPPEVIGPTAEGIRINFYFTGGTFEGRALRGRLRPVGGDQFLVRRDGVATMDIRATLETHDGALISAHHTGLIDMGPTGFEDTVQRKLGPRATGRVAARYESGHPDYAWLNRLQCVGALDVDRQTFQLTYDIYALR